jgi:ATP-binding cassette subfamily B protein
MYKFSVKLNQLSFEETESRHTISGQISDMISNIVSLFSFTTRQKELKNLRISIQNDYIPKQILTSKYDFKSSVVAGIFYIFLFLFLVLYMVHLQASGNITIGDFAFVFSTALVVGDSVWQVTVKLQDFSRSMGDLKSAISIIDPAFHNPDPENAKILQAQKAKIESKNFSFSYDNNKDILKNLNLLIKPGEKIGLVGHSGAGKTSLINLLLRYFENTNGEILIDDQNINDVTQDSLRSNIAVIPQETTLFHRSLLENIHVGKVDASFEEVVEASKKAHLHEFIVEFPDAYNTEVGERGLKLSGGQRQRIAIARAILKNAPILILDEATSALDSVTEKLIQDALNVLIEDKGKTVITIAHRLSTLKHMDRILVLDKGIIVEEGKHSELIHKPDSLYKRL